MSSSSEDMNLNGDLSVNNLTVRGTCTGCGGGGGTAPLAQFFTNVQITSAAGANLVGNVVPTTAPIAFPVGWRVVLNAFACVEGIINANPLPTFPLGAPASGGGIGTLTIKQDPGPSQIIWAGKATPVWWPYLNSDTNPTGYVASFTIAARGFFVSDGAPHVYEVEIGIPQWPFPAPGIQWLCATDAFDIGAGSPIPGLGLQMFAYPP